MTDSTTSRSTPSTLKFRPWPDPVIDSVGHDPCSLYVETFWLPILGPTSVLALRYLARRFADGAHEVVVDVAEMAQALGLGPRRGAGSPLLRSLDRLRYFDLAMFDGDGTVAVRRKLAPLSERRVQRLPTHLQEQHRALQFPESPCGCTTGTATRR